MAGGGGNLRHYQLTLTGSAQRLSTVIPSTAAQDPNPPCAFIDLQPDDGNSNVIAVGGDNAVSTDAYGVQLAAPITTVPPAPYRISSPRKPVYLADVWVDGTSDEVLNIFVLVE